MSDNRVRTDAVPPWHLPPTPGPFASLVQWREWRDQLVALGPGVPGIDAKINIAHSTIASMMRALGVEWSKHHGIKGRLLNEQDERTIATTKHEDAEEPEPLSDADLQDLQGHLRPPGE
jgi:hypothetical protein